jgi:fibronectin-binding autotransporter adhesin
MSANRKRPLFQRAFGANAKKKPFRKYVFEVFELESRVMPSVATPTFERFLPADGVQPFFGSATPSGTTPQEMRTAYGVNLAMFGSVVGDGTGQTIAIVDAYDQPNIASDLAAFDSYYHLPAPASFTQVNQGGGTSLPGADSPGGWGVETSLDVEWSHVIAPKASILLVEANSNLYSDLLAAVDTARNWGGVCVVSMSWGSGEFSGDSGYDSHFTTPAFHNGVTFVASSGDGGAGVDFPAVSPNVVGIGGTSLYFGTGGTYSSESGWGGSGGGISSLTSQPGYQAGVVTQSATQRTVPDVAMDADPGTGVPVYSTYDFGASTPWEEFGGTSLAAPMWSGVIAIANQGRAQYGLSTLDGPSGTLPKLYSLPSSDFNDVTTGSNGYAAGPGYDLVTGRGTPKVNLVVNSLAATWVVTDPNGNTGSGSPSDVTLPYAVANAQDGDSITFANNLSGDTITLNGSLTINHNFTITGLGAANLAVSGANANQVFNVPTGITTTISGLTIKQGVAAYGGGISNAGTLTLTADAVSNNGTIGNESIVDGAGVYNTGNLYVYDSTIAANSSYWNGGGIYNSGFTYMSDSTIANNAAYTDGGGIDNAAGTLELVNCTVSGNYGWNNYSFYPEYGGGIYAGGTVYLFDTIVAGNTTTGTGPDIYGTVYDAYYSLIGNTSGMSITFDTSNQLNVSANLGALANNGGTTLTMAPLPGSAAINTGSPAYAGTTSQNGAIRPATPDIGACQGVSWVVTDPNGNSGSGSAVDVTLPYAVTHAQDTDRITFASYLTGDTITLNGTLTINHGYSITGLGAANLAVSGNNLVQDFFVNPGVTASISGLTIENGNESNGGGGGILNDGALTVDGCLISGNNGYASGAYNGYGSGGGILNLATLTLTNSTVTNNASNFGGGLANYNGANATINDCTFTANSGASGAGICNFLGNTISLTNSTVAFNNGYGTWVTAMDNCIVAGNSSGNIYSGDSGNFTSTSTTGLATTLAYNGGTTPTLALSPGGAAHTAGNPYYAGTTSQNGATRPAAPDVGAYQGTLWIVTDPNGNAGSGGPGDITLPYAVANAQDSDQIIFANSLKGDTITLNSTLTINHSYTITGLGAANLAVSGGGSVRDFLVLAQGVTISNLNIENGSATYGGGIYNSGTLALSNDRITGNNAAYSGGGVFNSGTLSVSDSTFDGNSAYYGGGIDNTGFMSIATIDDCTFFGNHATYSGSGVNNWAGDAMDMSNCSIAYNTGGLAGVYNSGNQIVMDNCIVAGNTAADTYLTTGAFNLIGVTANMATSLADNGGATQTLALLPGSAAHASGDPGQAGTTSQNGQIRPAAPDVGACQGTSWIVTDPNGNAGSGSATDVTLPYAVAHAQDTDRITFANTLTGDTINLNGTLTIGHSYTITGLGATNLAVSGQNAVQDFVVNSGVTTTISGLTIENGQQADFSFVYGGGIANAGILTLNNDAVSNNGLISNYSIVDGAGIYNTGTLTVNDSTISGNSAYYNGGGIFNTGSATLTNSTISANAGYTYGGGIYTSGTMSLTDCTVVGNYGWANASYFPDYGGGIFTSGTTTMDNTIVAGNITTGVGPDIYGTIATANYCLIGNTSGNTITTGAHNLLNVSANLGSLAYNGGPTQTQAPLPGSPALFAGDPGQAGTTSQNGNLRPIAPDIGAYQSKISVTASSANLPDTATSLTINGSSFDPIAAHDSVAFNDGLVGTVTGATASQLIVTITTPPTALGALTAVVTCDGNSSGAPVQVATEVNGNWIVTDANGNAGSGSLTDVTLPYAVSHALDADTISFAGSMGGMTINLNGTLVVSHSYTVTGLGAANLAISGGGLVQDFFVNSGVTASISGLTIENGNESDGGGGGILNLGTLTVDGCLISGNNGTASGAYNIYGSGGGILNIGTLTLTNSTITGNTANYGGGLANFNGGNATVNDCTFTANTGSSGAGICNYAGNTLTLTNSTVAFNNGYGTWVTAMDNCIVAGNTSGAFYSGSSGAFTSISTTGLATTLAYNGGPTPTLKLSAGSPAIGAGDPGQAGTTSQNGVIRPASPDVGAYQSGSAPVFQSIVVNGGTPQYHDAFGNGAAEPIAGQNSVVEQILVTFNEPVTLSPNAFSITPYTISPDGNPGYMEVVVNSGPNPNQVVPILNAPIMVGDGHQWIITFGNNGATTSNGSGFYVLKDGVYSLNIDHTKVTANSQHLAADVGGPGASSFWALYGDTTFHDISGVDHPGYIGDGYSDASVGNADFQAFKAYYNADSTNYYAPPNYNVKFDANLDGSIANSDFLQFKTNYNTDWQF